MVGYYPDIIPKTNNYPDSINESKIVLKKMETPDWEFFKKSDKSPRKPFIDYLEKNNLEYDSKELQKIIDDTYPVIIALKKYYNRPRPQQVNSQIKAAKSKTAQTPAYPSGHTIQAYVIAKHLTKKYPLKRFKFYSIAKRISDSRVSVGLHYPSDNEYAKLLSKQL